MKIARIAACLAALILPHVALAQDRTFFAEGSDTVLGLGARHIAMGGTGTATAIDAQALYWNPAMLAHVDGTQITLTRQLNATLRPYAFLGAAVPVDWLAPLGLDLTVAAGRYPRVHARSTGAFSESDPQSIFLRLLLPGVQGTYDGDIDSKTMVNRFALALSPHESDRFSIGLNIDRIDCKTNTCGVHSASNGYETQSIHATAWSFGIGGTLKIGERLTLGAAVGDVDTTLAVDMLITDDGGVRDFTWEAKLPGYQRVEIAYEPNDKWLLAAGLQRFAGTYGSIALEFKTLHFGVERKHGAHFKSRLGAWIPLEMSSTNFETPDIPFPFVPSAGIGYQNGAFSADLAAYVHPVMSFHVNGPAPAAELTLSYRF